MEISIFIQVALGVGMVAGQKLKAPQFHMFYGFVALLTVALIYSYRAQMEKYRYLLYGGGGLFLMGLGIRAVLVGMQMTSVAATTSSPTVQVTVRVRPSIIWTWLTTIWPSSSMVGASARTITS